MTEWVECTECGERVAPNKRFHEINNKPFCSYTCMGSYSAGEAEAAWEARLGERALAGLDKKGD